MDRNIPGQDDPVIQFLEEIDIDSLGSESGLREFLFSYSLPRETVVSLLQRINPNEKNHVTILMAFLDPDLEFDFNGVEIAPIIDRIDPNTVIGSYAILVLQEAGLITEKDILKLREKIDTHAVAHADRNAEFGSPIQNLIDAGLVEITVPGLQKPLIIDRTLGIERLN
ncbi:MAG: hypothetical protein U0R17_05845 [Acidimicrobiia bacterium]